MTNSRRTITLTGRRPVSISEDDWPEIAHGTVSDASRGNDWTRKADLRVRQHADGRAVVYGTSISKWQGERDESAGELVPAGGDIDGAVRRVAGHLPSSEQLAHATLADMPAEEL